MVFNIRLITLIFPIKDIQKILREMPNKYSPFMRTLICMKIYIQNKRIFDLLRMQIAQLTMSQFKPTMEKALRNCETIQNKQLSVLRQRKDSGCLLKDQFRTINKDFQNQTSQKHPQNVADIIFWKMLLIGMTIAEFSLQTTVIVIQFVSSKISILPFVTSISITLILIVFVFISLKILSISKRFNISKGSSQNQKPQHTDLNQFQPPTSTLQKIKSAGQARMNQKTLKLKPVRNVTPKQTEIPQTLKQLKNIKKCNFQNKNSSFLSSISLNANMYLIIVTKSTQILFSLIACTICFCTIENPQTNGFSYIVLFLVFFYVLVTFSFAALVCLSFKIKQSILIPIENAQKHQLIITINKNCQIVANKVDQFQKEIQTILSIDNYISISPDGENNKQKQDHKSVQNIMKEGQKNIKLDQNTINRSQNKQNIKSNPNQLSQNATNETKNVKQCLSQHKSQAKCQTHTTEVKVIKKSMLKEPRNFQNKGQALQSGKNEKKFSVERKRVEINSNKIEYFEYANISPDNLERVVEESYQYQSKINVQKSKIFSQRNKLFQQKLIQEEELLERKRRQNVKIASKSAKNLSECKQTETKLKLPNFNNSNIQNYYP